MFKNMKWKLVAVFLLLVVCLVVMIGTFLFSRVSTFYHNDFITAMNSVFEGELKTQLSDASKTDNPVYNMETALRAFSGPLGIDSFRNYYILDSAGNILATSDSRKETTSYKSDNIILAMNNETGNKVSMRLSYMDYAAPIAKADNTEYIIYIKEGKNELNSIIINMFEIIINSLAISIIISILLAFLLSGTITKPISRLTGKAQKMAEGDFEEKIEVRTSDEIGKLTTSFNHMATELKETLDKIATEKNKLETILYNMTDGVVAFNDRGEIIHINPAACRILETEKLENETFESIFARLGASVDYKELLYLNSTKTIERELQYEGKYVKALFSPFTIESAKIGGVTVVMQDITRQQKLENERREFVANVSHELKTPITTVKSYVETLLSGALNDKKTLLHFLEVIDSESDRMTRLIKDLLLLSTLEYNADSFTKSPFSLDELIKSIVERLNIEAERMEHSLTYTKMTDIPNLLGDKDRIEQVITNIITNAMKYTPFGGKIEVFAGRLYDNTYIKIKDNGIGIPQKDIPRIFERFYRVDKARSREKGGTGLGLAIAKEIITAHGGDITIRSEVGEGTEVTITLPSNTKGG